MYIPKKIPPAYKLPFIVDDLARDAKVSETALLNEASVGKATISRARNCDDDLKHVDEGVWLKILAAYHRLKAARH